MFATLPFIVCLCWLVFLLLEWRRMSHAMHILTLFAGVTTMLYRCHALYFQGVSGIARYADTVYAFCNIAVFPLYYLYICRLTQPGKLTPRQWTVLIPAVIIGIWTALDIFVFPHVHALETWRILATKVVFVAQLVLVTCVGLKKIGAFDHQIMEFYSAPENRAANMTSYIMFVLSICSFISIIFSYIGREYFIDNDLMLSVPSVMFTVCLYAVCYVGYRQTFTADDLARDEQMAEGVIDGAIVDADDSTGQSESPQEPAQPEAHSNAEYERVCKLIEDNKWYRRPDLRLPQLALLVGIGRTRLSILINENSGMSISDFINRYRIDYACRILRDSIPDKEIVLAAISEQCGFMSDSPFYRNFKKFTGMTPAQYREQRPTP